MYARLARAIAGCSTIEEMQRLAGRKPEDALQEADREKYNLLAESLKSAANKLLCFMLPFRKEEAVSLFSQDPIKAAVIELLRYGLLRELSNERLEFHETVRKGLAGLVPKQIYTQAHDILAEYYLSRGEIAPAIFHFEQAEKTTQAHDIARKTFLEGKNRSELGPYVSLHNLLSNAEIVELLRDEKDTEKYYMLPEMLARSGDADTALALIRVAKEYCGRFDKDYQWAWRVVQAVMVCDPSKLFELVSFGIEAPIQPQNQDRLSYIVTGTPKSITGAVDTRLLELFKRIGDPAKTRLVELFLKDRRREILAPVLAYVYSLPEEIGESNGSNKSTSLSQGLKIATKHDACEFLAALPTPSDVGQMLFRRSALLGRLESFVWTIRHNLRPFCIEILGESTTEEIIQFNALRVLVFLQDDSALRFAEQSSPADHQLKALMSFLPMLIPAHINTEKYRSRILDQNLPMEDRIIAFFILSRIGEDTEQLITDLIASDPLSREAWKLMIVMTSAWLPCKVALPFIEEMIQNHDIESKIEIFMSAISKLSELPGKEITRFLLKMLSSKSKDILKRTCLSFWTRRSAIALRDLLAICHKDQDKELAQIALIAAIACGPSDGKYFVAIWPLFEDANIWRCILARRPRDVSEAEWLVATAIDQNEHWSVRRAAIMAASALPFDVALKRIYVPILAACSSLGADKTDSLLFHAIITTFIEREGRALLSQFILGKEVFVNILGGVFQDCAKESVHFTGNEAGEMVASWLFDRLNENGWPSNLGALEKISSEIHIPILQAAVLRGLRLAGRRDLLQQIAEGASTEWLLLRSVIEWSKVSTVSDDDLQCFKNKLSQNFLSDNASLRNIFTNLRSNVPDPVQIKPILTSEEKTPSLLFYEDVVRALDSGILAGEPPYTIDGLSISECITLAAELSPSRDYESFAVSTDPKIAFTQRGVAVRDTRYETNQKGEKVRKLIRPALAASLHFDIETPWHADLMAGIQGSSRYDFIAIEYSSDYLRSIAVQCDTDRLYQELDLRPELILLGLGKLTYYASIKKLIDKRIVPILRAFANVGTDEMFEALCCLSLCIEDETIDPVLRELLARWYNRFEKESGTIQHISNHILWRGFNYLTSHPRFREIPDYDLRLLEVMSCSLYWIHRNYIVDAVSKSPRSYIRIEILLSHAAPFEHFWRDEVDNYDEVAQKLFDQTAE
jgi:hypothetical protein